MVDVLGATLAIYISAYDDGDFTRVNNMEKVVADFLKEKGHTEYRNGYHYNGFVYWEDKRYVNRFQLDSYIEVIR